MQTLRTSSTLCGSLDMSAVLLCVFLSVLKVFFLSDLLTGLAKTQIMVVSNGH